jgi:hypothetical protein
VPIQGFRRLRKWQFGKQTVHGTSVAATRAVGLGGVMEINPNWTDPEDVDMGSIDMVLAPFRTQTDVTATLSGPLDFNDLPLMYAASIRGGVAATTSGTSKTWAFTALSTTATTLDEFTAEWGDDVTADGMRAKDGIIESLEFTFDEALGPWQVSADWRWGSVDAHVTPTAALTVGSNPIWAYGADTQLFINDSAGTIGNTQISDALRRGSVRIETTIDQKRYANGSNSRFALSGYGVSERTITASFTFEKQNAIIAALDSETVDWLNADPVNRFLEVRTQSTAAASSGVPYLWYQRFSGTWRTRTDEEIDGNDVVTLEMTGRYDSVLGYAYFATVTGTRATVP